MPKIRKRLRELACEAHDERLMVYCSQHPAQCRLQYCKKCKELTWHVPLGGLTDGKYQKPKKIKEPKTYRVSGLSQEYQQEIFGQQPQPFKEDTQSSGTEKLGTEPDKI